MTVTKVSCPYCAKRFGLPSEALGGAVACPHCGNGVQVGLDGTAGFASVSAAIPPVAPAAGGADDFVAFLNAQAPPPPTAYDPPPADEGGYGVAADRAAAGSRYNERTAGGPMAPNSGAAIVLRTIFCPQDGDYGPKLTERLKKVLEGEPSLRPVLISDDGHAWGDKATVEEGMAHVGSAGFGRYRTHTLALSAVLRKPDGADVPVAAQAKYQQAVSWGVKKAMMKPGCTKLANQVLRSLTGYKHIAAEISGYATATLVFGLIGLVPLLGIFFYPIGIVTGIMVLVYNRGRQPKIGMKRTWSGLIVGAIVPIASIIYLYLHANR